MDPGVLCIVKSIFPDLSIEIHAESYGSGNTTGHHAHAVWVHENDRAESRVKCNHIMDPRTVFSPVLGNMLFSAYFCALFKPKSPL